MKHAREDYNRIQDPEGLIPEDEPVFLLRGQDILAPDIIDQWAKDLVEKGGSTSMADMAIEHARAMRIWQNNNNMKKVPDLPPPEELALQKVGQVLGKYKIPGKAPKDAFPEPGTENFNKMKSEILSIINGLGE